MLDRIKHNMKPIFKYLCIPALITLPASSIYAEDEDVKYPVNHSITGLNNDYSGKNLFITWTKDEPHDGDAPIKGAQVTAQNITIEADFPDYNKGEYRGILNKGIYNTNNDQSDIKVPGIIKIFTYDDGVYTETNARANINGFKKLDITSRTGYGVVDNGNGINIEGGDGSTVIIKSKDRPAIANSMWTMLPISSYHLGKRITITADKIVLNSPQYSIFSGQGKDKKFEVTLDAQNIDITGTIFGYNGDIIITPRTEGEVNISAPAQKENSIVL